MLRTEFTPLLAVAVSVLSGLGGGASSRRETAGKVLPGGTVWTFALMD